jgi:hypothetical protein
MVDVTMAEESAFWEWVAVEILRHSGIRPSASHPMSH